MKPEKKPLMGTVMMIMMKMTEVNDHSAKYRELTNGSKLLA